MTAPQGTKDISADSDTCWAHLNPAQPLKPLKNLETFLSDSRPQGTPHSLEVHNSL